MSRRLVFSLYLKDASPSMEMVGRWTKALLSIGFAFEPKTGMGGEYWLRGDDYQTPDVDAAIKAFERSNEWMIVLWKPSAGSQDGIVDVGFTVVKPEQDKGSHFGFVSLSTRMPRYDEEPLLAREFLAWSIFLADLASPWYGWGGSNLGLYDIEPIAEAGLAKLEPQVLEWINVFGPTYVERIGLDKLISAPAWRAEFLASAGVALTLAEHPDRISMENVAAVARHLGIPGPALT